MPKDLIKISANEFSKRLKADSDMPDGRFAFFLGAGCSVSSGIPSAGSLVKSDWLPRLRDLRAPERKDLDVWAKEQFPEYDFDNPAVSYGPVMGQLFLQQEIRQLEVERLCDGKFPAFGYAVLATLVAQKKGVFNVVLTTNFDEMVPDALYLYTRARPLVIGHESLAGYIRPTRTRPLVIKLHGDFRLSPQNTSAETEMLKKEVERQIANLLHDRGLIVMGYGGNDQGIAKMLKALPKESLPFGIYWISGSEPQGILRTWLEERNAVWIQNADFDEMMLLIRDAFSLPHPDQKPLEAVFRKYGEMYRALSERILAKAEDTVESAALMGAVERADRDLSGWLAVYTEASRVEKTDPQRADQIYRDGMEKYPEAYQLVMSYANFLQTIQKDFDGAEEYYKKALELNPEDAITLGAYAYFLHYHRGEHEEAEKYYKLSLQYDPDNAINLGNYALFLDTIRKKFDEAEKYYLKSIEIDPLNSITIRNYALFLSENRGQVDRAEEYFQKAVEMDPNDHWALSGYASFLKNIRKDYDRAEEFYRRAVELNPDDANELGNFAGFLLGTGKETEGREVLGQAIDRLPAPAYSGLAAEIWFYNFAHWPKGKRTEALRNLKQTLLDGERSPNWDLSLNVERARKDEHPDIAWIEKLADVINDKADISVLDGWSVWEKA